MSDWHSAALADTSGSVEWWCTPRFDSPSVFARLLDPDGGNFSITPRGIEEVRREYQEGSLVLRTVFNTESGTAELLEGLAMAEGVRGPRAGAPVPARPPAGPAVRPWRAEIDIEFAPRFEYLLAEGLEGPCAVRDGNAAWQQPQHDVYGEMLSAAHRLREEFGELEDT